MKWPVPVLLAVALLFGVPSLSRSDEPAQTKQLLIRVKLLERNTKLDSLKTLAEPTVVTEPNRSFSVFSGGEFPLDEDGGIEFVEIGHRLDGQARLAKEGRVRLDLTTSVTAFAERKADLVQVNKQSSRTITTVPLGKTLKLPTGNSSTWLEVVIEEVKPSN